MRRTYRSKKDAGCGLDPRDMLQNVDEKSSAFDAFYIQNIKQTKREISCIGSSNQYGVASNKVRKRKYVKRILKEVEPAPAPSESLSQSVFLTPDKSIRVNKAYDPFDMLLNSSPAGKGNNVNVSIQKVQPKRDGKTYTRRHLSKAKKFNYSSYSSSGSDSNKENSDGEEDYTISNTSDIRTHKLLVEKEPKDCPKYLDDSIKNIVNNISLLNNINQSRSTTGNTRKSSRFNRNRLTNNIQSPILQKSPLCSTPFKSKYRGGSIFKFSPISAKDQEDSPNYVTVSEENFDNNDSFIFVSKQHELTTSEDHPQTSPVTHIPDSNKCETNNKLLIDKIETNEGSLYIDNTIENCNVISDNKPLSSFVISSIQTTEIEPFFGFCDDKHEDSIDSFKDQVSNNTDQSQKNEINDTKAEITVSVVAEHSIESVLTDENEKSHNLSSDSQGDEKESLYDTCSSNQSSSDEEIQTMSINPTVEMDRMNDSLFLKYYEKNINLDSEHEVSDSSPTDINRSNNVDSSSYESDTESLSNNSLKKNNCNMVPVIKDNDLSESNEEITSSNEDDLDSNNEEDRLISFVTTRRRNEVANSSILSILDESNSSSIYNCDKTVLGNYKMNTTPETFDVIRINSRPIRESISQNCPVVNVDCTLEDTLSGDELTVTSLSTNTPDIRKNDNILIDNAGSSSPNPSAHCKFEDPLSGDELNANLFIYDTNEPDLRRPTTIRKNSRTFRSTDGSNSPGFNAVCKYEDILISSGEQNVIAFTNITNDHDMKNSITIRKSSRTFRDTARTNSLEINAVSNPEDTLGDDDLNVNLSPKEQNTRKSIIIGKSSKEPVEISNKPVTEFYNKNNSTRMSTELLQENIPASPENSKKTDPDWKPIVLQPGKKWERSLSIYRRMSMITDHFDQSILEDEPMGTKGRKYRQSVISTMEMQELSGSQHNESINSRRSTFISKPHRSTIRFLKDPNSSRVSLCNTTVFDDSKGFLNDECDDTIIELSKLSIADPGSEVTVLDIHETSSRIATARDYVLRRCNQTDATLFDECYPDSVLKNCHKIGEGVYGEVFLWRDRDGRARVMKIVPVAGDIKVNGEHQKQFHEIISEIEIAMELSALRAPIAEINHHLNEGKDIVELDLTAIENATDVFNEVRAVRCVYGSYPSRLLDLWDLYDECKGSENDNPAILPVDQQYIVLELANAGQDLESYQFNNAEQAHALFLQVAFALAVGEEAFQFEHRDLHWGNVLIAPTDEKLATFVLRGRAYRVPRCGVAATVIDYSLSRLTTGTANIGATTNGALYNDLSTDDGLFDAVGDYQFEVYRLMRDKLGNDWKNFEPYTNILWLHYTVDKMITALRYKRINTKIHKHYIEKLKGIKNRILQYGSSVQFVLTDNEF